MGVTVEPVPQKKINTGKSLNTVPNIKPDLNKCPQYIIAVVIITYAAFS